jgi:hypothetical protein
LAPKLIRLVGIGDAVALAVQDDEAPEQGRHAERDHDRAGAQVRNDDPAGGTDDRPGADRDDAAESRGNTGLRRQRGHDECRHDAVGAGGEVELARDERDQGSERRDRDHRLVLQRRADVRGREERPGGLAPDGEEDDQHHEEDHQAVLLEDRRCRGSRAVGEPGGDRSPLGRSGLRILLFRRHR